MARWTRVALRAAAVLLMSFAAMLHYGVLCLRFSGTPPLTRRALWLHKWCKWGLKVLGISLDQYGILPEAGLVVSNHLSYLDILVFSAAQPSIFVAKIEVKSWPLFGLMTRLSGSLFIDRRRLRKLPATVREAEEALRHGVLLVVFPEATTTDGSLLLPFRPAFFQSAVDAQVPVTSAHICYTLEDGRFGTDLCWWGDVDLMPHVVSTFGKRRVQAHLRSATASHRFTDRKMAARITQSEVLELRAQEGPHAPALSGVTAAAASAAFGRTWQTS